jgi:hypothetical protein
MTTASFALDEVRPTRRLWSSAALAVALADGANSIAYLAGSAAGLFPRDVLIPGLESPVTIARVLVSTTIGTSLGALGFAVVRRFAKRPYPVFRLIALVVLLASYTQPTMVLHAPLRMVIALNVLHTIAAAVVLWAMRRGAE